MHKLIARSSLRINPNYFPCFNHTNRASMVQHSTILFILTIHCSRKTVIKRSITCKLERAARKQPKLTVEIQFGRRVHTNSFTANIDNSIQGNHISRQACHAPMMQNSARVNNTQSGAAHRKRRREKNKWKKRFSNKQHIYKAFLENRRRFQREVEHLSRLRRLRNL